MWLLLALIVSSLHCLAEGQACPYVSDINPKSGLIGQTFTIIGTSLNGISNILTSTDGLTVNYTVIISTILTFNLQPSSPVNGIISITLVPADTINCNSTSYTLDIKPVAPLLSTKSSDVGQPGTVITAGGCFPPTCGDNSTTYTIRIGNIDVMLLSSTTTSFTVRLIHIDTPITMASINLISQYGTVYLLSGHTIDYMTSGLITSIDPSMGQDGTQVMIMGTNLLGVGAGAITLDNVTFGGVPAVIIGAPNQSLIVCRVPSNTAGPAIVNINSTQVIGGVSYDGPYTSVSGLWTQLEDGVITLLAPPAGHVGTTLYICGLRLRGGGMNITNVTFNNVSATSFTNTLIDMISAELPSECISAVVPSFGNESEASITLTSNTGAVVHTQTGLVYRLVDITSISPNSGQEYTYVTIRGTGLLSGYANTTVETPVVKFNSIPGLVQSYSDGVVIVQPSPAPSNITGQSIDIEIQVTRYNMTFTVSQTSAWEYLEAGHITGLEPRYGQYGTHVTIIGEQLLGYGRSLMAGVFSGTNTGDSTNDPTVSADIISYTESMVILGVPDPVNHSFVGHCDITLIADNGARVSGYGIFEYRKRGRITSVSPREGQLGTYVTITGAELYGYGSNVTNVTFGSVAAAIDYASSSAGSIRARVMDYTTLNDTPVNVTITSDTHAIVASLSSIWTYLRSGEISLVAPLQGQTGSYVTVTGINLLGGGTNISMMYLDGVPPLYIFPGYNSTHITVQLGNDSNRDTIRYPSSQVYIESDTGSIVTGGSFKQLSPGMITSFSPLTGRQGTLVTIRGYNLTGHGLSIARITVAGYLSSIISHVETNDISTLIIQISSAPNGTIGMISITSDSGAIITSNMHFTYDEPGSITGVTPAAGSEGVGLLIQGILLQIGSLDIVNVTIGGSQVTRIVTKSSNQVSVIAGPATANITNQIIRVTSSDGSFIEGGSFTYDNLSLTIIGRNAGQHGTQLTLSIPFPVNQTAAVFVGDQRAPILSADSAGMTVTVSAPRANEVGQFTVDVSVEDVDNAIVRLRDGFTYLSEGIISSVTPDRGQRGTIIVIAGERLLGGGTTPSSVTFGNILADIHQASNEEITLSLTDNLSGINSYPYATDVAIISNTGAIVSRLQSFSFVQPGIISSIAPASGQYGTMVTIRGTSLLQEGTPGIEVISVTLAGYNTSIVGTPNDTHIQVMAINSSDEAAGSVIITLSSGAQITSPDNIQFQYQPAGVISSVTPSIGTVGTCVYINGTNLLGGGTSVQSITLNGISADVISFSNERIIVRANIDYNATAAGPVIIVSDTGAIVEISNGWMYEELGNISSINPLVGQQGLNVTIEGYSLIGSSGSGIIEVTLAGIPATILHQSDAMVTVRAGYGNESSGPVIVTTLSGSSITSDTNWSYYQSTISSIYPMGGVNGTHVMINGINLTTHNDSISQITFGDIKAYDITVLSYNSVSVRAGYSPVSTGPLTVGVNLTSGIYLTLNDGWSYDEPGVITSIHPSVGLPGTNITIYGTSLVPPNVTGVSVMVGRSGSFRASVINSSVVQFTAGVYQGVDVPGTPLPLTIISYTGSVVYNDSLFIYNITSNVTDVQPVAGGTGSIVRIYVSNVSMIVSNVLLAGVPAAEIINITDDVITVRAGNSSDINGQVIIELPDGSLVGLASHNSWTYLLALNISHVSPSMGRNGTRVSINVSLIPSAYTISSVTLAGISATIVSSNNNEVVVIATNPAPPTASGDIILRFQDSIELAIPNGWTYQLPLNITNITPSAGYYGALMTINGNGFQGGSAGIQVRAVLLAGLNTTILNQSDTQLNVIINDLYNSSAGNVSGPIAIEGIDGSIHVSSTTGFTYLQVYISSVTPSNGQEGTIVSIRGTGLLAGGTNITTISLANVPAMNIISKLDDEIIITAALSSVKTNISHIIYVMDTGAIVTAYDSWYYVSPGYITSVRPASGSHGTTVTITGQGLLNGGERVSSVLLDGVPVMDVSISHDTFVQVRAGYSTGPSGAGPVMIIANTGAIISSLNSSYYYQYTLPGHIDSLIPSSGQYGTLVGITGRDLYTGDGIDHVTVSGIIADILSYNDTTINIAINRPIGVTASIEGPVAVTSLDGTITTSTDNFTYLEEGEIHTVHPQVGQRGCHVTITGTRLTGGGSHIGSVFISAVEATIASETDSSIDVIVNDNYNSIDNEVTGNVELVSDSGARVIRIDGWTYVQEGIIESISPAEGQYGTIVTIYGQRLLSGGSGLYQAYIGSIPALNIVSSNDSVVILRAGETDNTYNVSMVTLISDRYSNLSSSNVSWYYRERSRVTNVNPSNSTGGMMVNITGYNMLGGGANIISVVLAGIEVGSITMATDSLIEVETGFNPDGQPRVGDIVITSDTGALTVVTDGWSYESECPVGQHGNSSNSCSSCHPECYHCYGPSEFDCYSCNNFRIIHNQDLFECTSACPSLSTTDKICVDSCLTNQYQQISSMDGQAYCLDCHPLCDPNLSCDGPAPSQCTGCSVYVENGVCVDGCSVGTYISNRECLPCHEQCLSSSNCTGPEPYQCNKCANVSIALSINDTAMYDQCISDCPSMYYTDDDQKCQSCHSECFNGCTGPRSLQCNNCSNANIVHSNGTIECVSDCNPSPVLKLMYQNPFTGQCMPCHRLCSIADGCSGPSPADCVQCSNFTGSNTAIDEFVPKYDGECVQKCPNESFYADMRNGYCELCDESCTIGCIGPYVNDCIILLPTASNPIGPFDAGSGTIALTVIVIFVIISVFVTVIVALSVIVIKRSKSKYNFANNDHQIELAPTHFTRTTTAGTSINRYDSKVNPAYTGYDTSIELMEEDEHSLGRSLDNIRRETSSPVRPPSGLSDEPSSPSEQSTLLPSQYPPSPVHSSVPPPIPVKRTGPSTKSLPPMASLQEPTEIYMEMDDDNDGLTQEEYTDMTSLTLPPELNITNTDDNFYEITESEPVVPKRDHQSIKKIKLQETNSAPPAVPPRSSTYISEPPAIPPKSKHIPPAASTRRSQIISQPTDDDDDKEVYEEIDDK